MTTILVAGAVGEKTAKDAMLGVKDWQMLIGHYFELGWAYLLRQCTHLRRVEIIGGRQLGQPKL